MVFKRDESTLTKNHSIFNRRDVIAQGWYWLVKAKKLKKKCVIPITILGQDIALFRGASGKLSALDAYCPHMGAHLAEGKVDGDQLRCFFHNWCFDAKGTCTDIPSLGKTPSKKPKTNAWTVDEKHGLIWIWLGDSPPTHPIPEVPELLESDYEYSLGNRFKKHCHPNVVMVNAIDEQHFHTVHKLPGSILSMEPIPKTDQHITFDNTGRVPNTTRLGKCISKFYKDRLTYRLNYWYGSVGTVTLGPDFLHCYLMFALRLTAEGRTEGYTIAFTRKRKTPLGWLFNRIILNATKLVGYYFAVGDTRVFKTIQFDFKTPTKADRAVIAFINHLEKQPPYTRRDSVCHK